MRIQVAVAHGEGCRKPAFQLLQQSGKGGFLGRRACVSRVSAVVQPAFVADADAVAVMAEAVCALGRERPAGMYPAVACDVIVVAYVPEVPETDVVPAAVLERVRLPAARGAAMDDEQCDTSHASLSFFMCVSVSLHASRDAQGATQGCRDDDDYFENDTPDGLFFVFFCHENKDL